MHNASLLSKLEHLLTEPIQDPLWGHIKLPKEFIEVIRSNQFIKLHDIKQLGPSYLVYPGATHTRANHSIGVYHIAQLFVKRLLSKNLGLSFEGILAFLLAALTHDMGHFPYTHSLKELPLKDHEVLTSDILIENFSHQPIAKLVNIQMAAQIVNTESPTNNPEVDFYRKLLSGVLDPDKLDYLRRDAYFCGLPFGEQDLDFVLEHTDFDLSHGIVMREPGIKSIEHILFSKYLMYRSVYWNSSVRIATGMVKKALFMALEKEKLFNYEKLYYISDHEFFDILSSYKNPVLEPALMVKAGRLYQEMERIDLSHFANDKALMSLETRHTIEQKLAALIGIDKTNIAIPLIIDVPERISFESDILIIKNDQFIPYNKCQTVFTKDVVGAFTQTLRHIRIAIHPSLVGKALHVDIKKALLEIMKDYYASA